MTVGDCCGCACVRRGYSADVKCAHFGGYVVVLDNEPTDDVEPDWYITGPYRDEWASPLSVDEFDRLADGRFFEDAAEAWADFERRCEMMRAEACADFERRCEMMRQEVFVAL